MTKIESFYYLLTQLVHYHLLSKQTLNDLIRTNEQDKPGVYQLNLNIKLIKGHKPN